MTLDNLQNKWNKEKESYKSQELGSGVHSFIRDCLEAEELFALKEGAISTKLENRRKEYIHENKTKEGRRADFAIYIDSEVIIPCEAECFGNIHSGIEQIFNYQKDFEKHYGILTDGYSWRFYNNNIYRQFNIDQMLKGHEVFREFWLEYIKPESYYLSFFEPHGQLSFLKEMDILHVEKNRQMFFEDITKLIKSFSNKLRVEGYFDNIDDVENSAKQAVEITYAYVIQFILYKTLVDNDFGVYTNEFKEIVESIHDCLTVKQYGKILGVIEGISNQISEKIYRPFRQEQDFINQNLRILIRNPKNELHDVSPWLDIFVFIMKYNFTNIQNDIFGYIYENYLKELFEDGKKGQYYTDPSVVNFMLKQVGFTPKDILNRFHESENSVSIIDPACGSGTFLYSAVDVIINGLKSDTEAQSKTIEKLINDNVFGLDIIEFPLYLAEMSILMRMLPIISSEQYNNPVDKKIKVFLTKDSIAEFLDTNMGTLQMQLAPKEIDLGYKSYVREEIDLLEMKQSLDVTSSNRFRFDYVVGNPPYISYNECAKQQLLAFKLMKEKKLKLSDVYGVNLHSTPDNRKTYPPKPNLYSFFIALGISLLKENGHLCYIIPQTILTEPDYDVIRYHIAKNLTIKKIITFSGKMFVGRGIKQNRPVETSSLIFVVQRKAPSPSNKVEVLLYDNVIETKEIDLSNFFTTQKPEKRILPQSLFLENTKGWNFIRQTDEYLEFHSEYQKNTDGINFYYDHELAQYKFKSKFYFDVGFILNDKYIRTEFSNDQYELIDFKNFVGYSKYKPVLYYPKDEEKIELPKNCQGHKVLEQKYKIVWSKVYSDKFYFTDRAVLPSMSTAQIISSNNKEELMYLFALLNSSINKYIYLSQFKLENEQYGIFVAITRIKGNIRIPKITEKNDGIKQEVIKYVSRMLDMEDLVLSDFVDFSKLMMQKCDSVFIKGSTMILVNGTDSYKLAVKSNADLISQKIHEEFVDGSLGLNQPKISMAKLRNLPIIDFDLQNEIKGYIDDLIFALYFGIRLDVLGFDNRVKIRNACKRHKHYNMLSEK